MFTVAEPLVRDAGLDWVLCGTAGPAIAKPEAMSDENLRVKVAKARECFAPLNPYAAKGSC